MRARAAESRADGSAKSSGEGTTSSISFVYDVLFEFARRHVARFLETHRDDPAVQQAARALATETGAVDATLADPTGTTRLALAAIDLMNRSLLSDFLPVQGIRGLGMPAPSTFAFEVDAAGRRAGLHDFLGYHHAQTIPSLVARLCAHARFRLGLSGPSDDR